VLPAQLSLGSDQGHIRVCFSPNTPQKSKPKTNPPTPPDMAEVFSAIDNAEFGVLFLLFSAGSPSILQHIKEVEKQRVTAQRQFFVRGAISDARTSTEFATRVYNDSARRVPNTLITGVAGVRDRFAFWEKELAQLGHAVIHDKVLVVDPFTDKSIVVTGSHNLGFKASYSNDENMCVISGNSRIARAYAAHVLDIVNHYNWRHQLKEDAQGNPHAFTNLSGTDVWQDKYFRDNFLASRDQFFFPGANSP
jgi:phosphatidylserine/phosphatidylglycerophosphate/cardiolipin synthase-like enzyme